MEVLAEHAEALDAAEADSEGLELLRDVLRVAWRMHELDDTNANMEELRLGTRFSNGGRMTQWTLDFAMLRDAWRWVPDGPALRRQDARPATRAAACPSFDPQSGREGAVPMHCGRSTGPRTDAGSP